MRTLTFRQLLVAAGVVATTPYAARAQASATPSAVEIIARAAKAVDPKGSFAGHRSVRSTSDVEIVGVGITGKAESYAARPDKFLSQTTLGPIGTVSTGFDGSVGWLVNPATGPSLMDPGQIARSRHLGSFEAALQRPETFKSMSDPVVETFEGRSCYKLHLVSTTAFEYDAYYDAETGLRRGLRYDEKGPMGTVPVTMIFDEYREFGGVMVASKVTQRTATLSLVQKTTSVEFDAVADSMFALPPAIKALAGK
jgi:hypothetical protein